MNDFCFHILNKYFRTNVLYTLCVQVWTCTKCSYAYNPLWSPACDICSLSRSPIAARVRTRPSKDQHNQASAHDRMSADSVNNNKEVERGEHSLQGDFQYVTQDILNGAHGQAEGMGEDSPTWSCHKCTLENPHTEAVCLACGGSRLKSVNRTLSASGGMQGWVCHVCTLENMKGVQKCKACDTLRDGNVEEINFIPSKPGHWVCKVCTFENSPKKLVCQMCSAPNPLKGCVGGGGGGYGGGYAGHTAGEGAGRPDSACSTGSVLQPRIQSRDMERLVSTFLSIEYGHNL